MTWLEICGKNRDCSGTCPYGDGTGECEDSLCREDLMADALVMLKEQQQQIWEHQDHVEYLTDKLKEQEEKYKKLAEWAEGHIVFCKDCKHHRKDTCSAAAGMAFPPPDDWFCADGERREIE